MTSQLRKKLESKAGTERIYLCLPYVFLPPRFAKVSQERDLLLMFDDDFTLHVRWRGEKLVEPHELKKNEASRLLKEVSKNMGKYRQDLLVISRFIGKVAEEPYERAYCEKPKKEQEAQREPTEQEAEGQEEDQSEIVNHLAAINQLVGKIGKTMEAASDG